MPRRIPPILPFAVLSTAPHGRVSDQANDRGVCLQVSTRHNGDGSSSTSGDVRPATPRPYGATRRTTSSKRAENAVRCKGRPQELAGQLVSLDERSRVGDAATG